MDAAEMVRQLKVRQSSIVELLPKLHEELEQIQNTVRELEGLLGKGYVVDVPIPLELAHLLKELPTPTSRPKETRLPLSVRRMALRKYLAENGPATRSQIMAATGIPAGSLSALLGEDDIATTQHGMWHLKGTAANIEEDD
jgi:hypothetical protein